MREYSSIFRIEDNGVVDAEQDMNEPSPAEVLFFAALEKATPEERAAYLDEACSGKEALRQRVERLLAAYPLVGQFLERPITETIDLGTRKTDDGIAADLGFLAASTAPDSLGRLDHYEVLEVVGRGGTGIVLRARDTNLLRIVALKVLAAPLSASGTARRRFAREACSAAAVRDDHVVDIHAVYDTPVPYLVMEFIDGCNLKTLVRRNGPLEVKEILRIGIQVANGLAAAHKQGLIHRDVKPANILLENGVQRVKLTDFGLARAADDASLSQSGVIAGTPLYMAPEQAAGETIDARADLFSLGSVLYELCTGRPAFRAETTVAVLKRVCEETPRPIREINPDIPVSLCRLIELLHAKKPADRPSSATQVAELLTQLLAALQGIAPEPELLVLNNRSTNRSAVALRRYSWLWVCVAGGLLFAGLGLSEAIGLSDVGGAMFRLFYPDGLLIVEVDDPEVSVAVDGEEVFISGAGKRKLRLNPGLHQVEARKAGKVIRQELISLVQNGRQVVRISREAEPLTEAERWQKSIAELPAEQQVQAVAQRLQELNPGFDGRIKPQIVNGVVKGLEFLTDEVTDVSPVRAFKGLESLSCSGTFLRKGKLSDLAPLRGMSLKLLKCNSTRVEDLSPLRGMPLKVLICGETRVYDLTPLTEMKLETLTLQRTEVLSLAPLKGMPLAHLDLFWAQNITDLKVLEGMPLRYLNLTALRVYDLSILANLDSLEELILDSMPVTDLTPLQGLHLKALSIRGAVVTDLSPLKNLPLKWLRLDYQSSHKNFIKSLSGLEFINNKPIAEFWKEADSK